MEAIKTLILDLRRKDDSDDSAESDLSDLSSAVLSSDLGVLTLIYYFLGGTEIKSLYHLMGEDMQ